jgi:hypothetical protein
MAEQSTSINLKTREGALCATFTPPLTSEQHASLLHDTTESHGVKMELLAEFIVALANSWGRRVLLDPCPPYPPPREPNP